MVYTIVSTRLKGAISQKAYVLGREKAYWVAFYNSVCSQEPLKHGL
jgi:hypothetical protein